MKYHEVEEDPDTLAILYRGDLEVRFITADSGALGANDYRVLLWGDDSIVVGISEAYSKDIIDEFVVDKVTKDIVSDFDVDDENDTFRFPVVCARTVSKRWSTPLRLCAFIVII